MAIDTAADRVAIAGEGLAAWLPFRIFPPDGTVDAVDRLGLLGVYGGFAETAGTDDTPLDPFDALRPLRAFRAGDGVPGLF